MDKQAAESLRTFALAHGEMAFAHLVTAALGGEKVIADTVTDEEIEALLASCDVTQNPDDRSVVDDCYRALGSMRAISARARCAEILNARRAGEEWAVERIAAIVAFLVYHLGSVDADPAQLLDAIRSTDTTRPDGSTSRTLEMP